MAEEIERILGRLEGLMEGVKDDVESLNKKLDDINGRVRTNEKDIAQAKGIGAVLGIIFGILGGFLKELIRK